MIYECVGEKIFFKFGLQLNGEIFANIFASYLKSENVSSHKVQMSSTSDYDFPLCGSDMLILLKPGSVYVLN